MKNTRMRAAVSIMLLLLLVFIPLSGCKSASGASAISPSNIVQVKRGDVATYISASGNLAFSHTQNLAFPINGNVIEVDVEAGDNVTKGQVMAKLDTVDLRSALDSTELALQTAQLNLQDAQNAQNTITSAQIDLETATNNFSKMTYPYNYQTFAFDVPAAIVAITDAQRQLAQAQSELALGPNSDKYGDALDQFRQAQDNLTTAQQRLLRGQGVDVFLKDQSATALSTQDFWSLRAAQLAMQKAQSTLNQAKINFQSNVAHAQVNLQTATKNRDNAKEDLAKAVITAPFDAFVTAVNIKGGDEWKVGQVAFTIAEPNKLEAGVLVNEIDIPWVVTGARTSLQMDAVPGLSVPAIVTKISPTAIIQQGVVTYTVTIEVQLSGATPNQPGQSRSQPASRGQSAVSRSTPPNVQLRQGLSVTANILREQRKGVLLVPNRAIIRQGANTFVQVLKGTTTEQQAVTIGLSDSQNTEITTGLTEGESVVLPARATSATPTNQSILRPGGLGGLGR